MQRYCLTKCAKKKLSKLKEYIITLFSIMGAIIIAVLIAAIVLYIFGLITTLLLDAGLFPEPDKPFGNTFAAGLAGIIMATAVSMVGYLVYIIASFLFNIFKSIGIEIAHRFDKDYESCTLFEKCDE